MKLSQHCINDNMERLTFISLHLGGFGDPFVTLDKGDRLEILTTTGVVLIKAKDRNFLITAYIASLKRAIYIYRTANGNKRMPDWLYSKVDKNQKWAKAFVMKYGSEEAQKKFRQSQKMVKKR